jgi:ABC-type Zn2+ transport system substrate-binding protein/surface adhesin
VPWGQLILAARGNGNWTEYRTRREDYENYLRRTLYTSPPRTRVYFRLTEPHRFQGEANNDHNNDDNDDNDDIDDHDHDHDLDNNTCILLLM